MAKTNGSGFRMSYEKKIWIIGRFEKKILEHSFPFLLEYIFDFSEVFVKKIRQKFCQKNSSKNLSKTSSKKFVKKICQKKSSKKFIKNFTIGIHTSRKLKKALLRKKGKSQTNKKHNSVLRSLARPQADGKLKNKVV